MASSDPPSVTSPSPTTFPHELTDSSSSAAKRKAYAVAAAAARRKRRRAMRKKARLVVRRATQKRGQDDDGGDDDDDDAVEDGMNEAAEGVVVVAAAKTEERQQTTSVTTLQPDVHGVQDVASKLRQGEKVAVPTECTYEVLQKHERYTEARIPPHVFLQDVSMLETHPFWKQVLCKKAYAIKGSRGRRGSIGSASSLDLKSSASPSAVANFNEVVQVLRQLSSKIWPGHVLIYAQVKQAIPGLTLTTSSTNEPCYTSESNVRQYIALRSPCHPLTVKICHEFYTTSGGSGSYSPSSSPLLAPLKSPSPPLSPVVQPPLRTASSNSLSSSGSSTSPSAAILSAPLLVGWPLQNRNGSFVTASEQVEDDSLVVLNGEERREIFSVPTCEMGQPCPLSLWINVDRRTILIKDSRNKSVLDSSSESSVSASALNQALRSFQAKSAKERVIQAVLLKWNVVSCEA